MGKESKADHKNRLEQAMLHLRRVERQRQSFIDDHPLWGQDQFLRSRRFRILDAQYENAERVVENLKKQL